MRTVQHGSEYSATERVDTNNGQTSSGDAVAGPDQRHRSAAFSLPSGRMRWVPQRKAEVVEAVRDGLLTLDQARERYALSIEEFLTWQHGVTLFGLAGLRVYGTQGRERTKSPPEEVGPQVRLRRKAARLPAKADDRKPHG
jgi:hypothetical protein